jgi:hypothetical protein
MFSPLSRFFAFWIFTQWFSKSAIRSFFYFYCWNIYYYIFIFWPT